MKYIDNILNTITMYRLVLYVLVGLLGIAVLFSAYGLLPYDPLLLLFSIGFISVTALVTNMVFASTFQVPANVESVYITAFILALIITPPQTVYNTDFLILALWASILSIASKYIIAIYKKHIFNPVAIGVALTALTLGLSATWWVGTTVMLPYVLIGGLLIVRKTLRSDLVYSFVIVALFTIIAPKFVFDAGILSSILKIFTNTPLVFFACIMLTEPFTTPPTARLQMVYGVIVGFLFAPAMHIGSFYTTPELALLVGNVFSYIVSPKRRLALTLVEKNQLSPDIYDFVFKSDTSLAFRPGQYLEWTLGHEAPDARGNRRYFTIASAPTESMIRVGAKFYDNSSTFKKNLRDLNTGDVIFASQLAGDFTLPREKNRKLVFIAGGIGVTPFRSMVQYMIDMKEQRQVVMLYAGKTPQDLVYSDIFTKARLAFGMKTVYVVNKNEPYLPGITEGVITTDLIIKEIPDYKERDFYISGPHGMVMAFTDTLQTIGIPKRRIHSDFFPGLV